MFRRSLTAAVAAAVLLGALTGCFTITPPAPEATTVVAPETQDPDTVDYDSPVIIEPDGSDCDVPDGVDFEGYFDESGTLDFLSCVVPAVDAWMDSVYGGSMRHPRNYLYIPEGVTTQTGCVDVNDEPGIADDYSAFYCGGDRNVYLGHRQMWEFYDELGDGSVFVAIAHEVTHHIQGERGTYEYLASQYGAPLPPEATRLAENQADCGAGAFIRYEDDLGAVDEDDDIQDIADTLVEIASSEDDVSRDHGDVDERTDSFAIGLGSTLDQPIAACDEIIPGVSLLG